MFCLFNVKTKKRIISTFELFTNQSYEIAFLGSKVDLGVLLLYKSLITLLLVGTIYYLLFRGVSLIKLCLNEWFDGTFFSFLVFSRLFLTLN